MKLQMASRAGRPWRRLRRQKAEGGGWAVVCASAAPLIALALAVAVDRAHVSRFRTQVQLAADAASLAVAGTIARHPNAADDAGRVAAAVFARNAPRGAAGTPTVAATSRAALVTATVGYDGVAPSNFGSAFGYGAISVKASATSPALVADSRPIAVP
jgi:Flp pilus assembly protein TadG